MDEEFSRPDRLAVERCLEILDNGYGYVIASFVVIAVFVGGILKNVLLNVTKVFILTKVLLLFGYPPRRCRSRQRNSHYYRLAPDCSQPSRSVKRPFPPEALRFCLIVSFVRAFALVHSSYDHHLFAHYSV